MKCRSAIFALALFLTLTALEAAAMVAQKTRVAVWRRGETIGGEEFLAANEEIVDYLATLPRPTEGLKAFKYDCQVKSRLIRPSVQNFGVGGTNQGWVYVRMVYELRDCVQVP